MTVSYNKALVGVGSLTVLALAGGVLLGLGLAGSHIGTWGGHTWQLASGSSMLGIGIIGGAATLIYIYKSRSKDLAMDALQQDSRTRIWTYAHKDGQEVMIGKSSTGKVMEVKPGLDASKYTALQEAYTRVVPPLFASAPTYKQLT